MSAEPMIEVRGLKKSFGEIEVLRNISLTVERGQVVALIGPSGSGKSTLLRSLNLLSLPDAGYIAIGEQKIDFSSGNVSLKDKYLAAFRANTGMVFQNFNLFPHMSVLDNVMIGPVTVLKQDKRLPANWLWNCWRRLALPPVQMPDQNSSQAVRNSVLRLQGRSQCAPM